MATVSFDSLVRCVSFSADPCSPPEGGVLDAPFCWALDPPPAPVWLRLRRRRADRLVPDPFPSPGRL